MGPPPIAVPVRGGGSVNPIAAKADALVLQQTVTSPV
jgi:hypothetical protein